MSDQGKQETTDAQVHVPNFEDLKVIEVAQDNDFVPPPVPQHPPGRYYSIDDAITLMKKMPEADMRVLATVIKETLESTDIKVSNIIKDAENKENRLEERIKKLDSEIDDLEVMISQRKDSIHSLLHDLEETRQVKNNLALAIGSQGVEISVHSSLKSKAAHEYNSIKEQSIESSEGVESVEKSSELADKSILLDALFAKPEEETPEQQDIS